MNKKLLIIVLFAFVLVNSIKAQTYQKTDLGIKSIINSIEVEIQFYGPSTVRVLKSPEGNTFTKESLSVIKVPQKTAFSIKQAGDKLSIKSESIQVILNLKNGKNSFSTPTGESLLNEKEAGVVFTDFNDAGVKTYSVSQSFVLDYDEAIYVGLPTKSEGLGSLLIDLIDELGIKKGSEVPSGVMVRQINKTHFLFMNVSGEPKEIQMKGKSRSILFDKDYSGNFTISPYELEYIELK